MKSYLKSPKFLGMNAKHRGFCFSFLAMLTMTIFTLILGGFVAYPFGVILSHSAFNLSIIIHGFITLIIDMIIGIPLNIKYWKYIGC